MSQTVQLDSNLFSIIHLAKKDIEVFLKKTGQPSKIIADNKIFKLADIIKNQYII